MRWIIACLLLVAVTGQLTEEYKKKLVTLTLYNNDLKTNHPDGVQIWPENPQNVVLENLKLKELKVFIHGYLTEGKKFHKKGGTTNFLNRHGEKGDVNVIIVTWPSKLIPYRIAAHRAMDVGEFMAEWLRKTMCENKRTTGKGDLIHLIGHSLGAQAVGKAGRMMTNKDCSPKRVTGLDPAGPYFEWGLRLIRGTEPIGRDSGQFVDIIHTNPGIFGVKKRYGHLDFYVDGGKQNLAHFRDHSHTKFLHRNKKSHSYATTIFINSIKEEKRYPSSRCKRVRPSVITKESEICTKLPPCTMWEKTNYAGMGAVPEQLSQSYRTDLPDDEMTEKEMDGEEVRPLPEDDGEDMGEGVLHDGEDMDEGAMDQTGAVTTTETPAAINGGWSSYSECSTTCGGGTQSRTCSQPKPSNGGLECQGDNSMVCNTAPCACTHASPCGVGGKCDGDSRKCTSKYYCGPGNVCRKENWKDQTCNSGSPCGLGGGDCNNNGECYGDLRCGNDNCPFGKDWLGNYDDCCIKP